MGENLSLGRESLRAAGIERIAERDRPAWQSKPKATWTMRANPVKADRIAHNHPRRNGV
jgi:hypothetical protein